MLCCLEEIGYFSDLSFQKVNSLCHVCHLLRLPLKFLRLKIQSALHVSVISSHIRGVVLHLKKGFPADQARKPASYVGVLLEDNKKTFKIDSKVLRNVFPTGNLSHRCRSRSSPGKRSDLDEVAPTRQSYV